MCNQITVWGAVAATFATAYAMDQFVHGKILPTTTKTMSKEWLDETERKLDAWPRTAGPPAVMNPVTRQNFIVKSRSD